MGNLEHNKADKISRIQAWASGSGETLSVPIMKTVVHIKKIFQVVRSPSSHLANTRLEGTRGQGGCIDAKNVENRTGPRKI